MGGCRGSLLGEVISPLTSLGSRALNPLLKHHPLLGRSCRFRQSMNHRRSPFLRYLGGLQTGLLIGLVHNPGIITAGLCMYSEASRRSKDEKCRESSGTLLKAVD